MKKLIPVMAFMTILLSGCGAADEIEIISDGSFATTTTVPDIVLSEYTVTSTSTTTTTALSVYGITFSTESQTTTADISTTSGITDIYDSYEDNNNSNEISNIPDESDISTETTTTVVTEPHKVETIRSISPEIQSHLAQMSLHEKICQMFIVTPEAISGYDTVTYVDCSFHNGYKNYPVGGLIFFAQNIESSAQTSVMITDIQNDALYTGIGAFIAVDEEGGTITRVQSKLGTEAVFDMNYYGELNDWDAAFSVGSTIGSYLSYYGFNLDFAPVADVNISPYNELGSRIFSTDPQIVADMSGAVVDGLQSQGICSTLKHFPGLGAGSDNTHYNSVWIDRTHEQLAETEFPAFMGGIEAESDFIMVGHQITSAAGDNLPSDLSPIVVTDWLRGELGFDGIAVTDSHAMGAISNIYTSGDAAVLAVEAGIDVILMPYSLEDAVAGLELAVESGRITESRIDESVSRILEKKYSLGLI